ncbi:U2 snRNP complex subunit BUD31 Ecym_2488 [Eremothecium cymbalariae DBVPG|uniref:Bud site selection protein 31 n=1 Tax=Eremothecium cymbalariae (strain CBS 270.75 / DBVPG 7215 / KCTC 17166 / NRRL Y-17582) TaxID=931890 RepID=G8JPV2_ERECY|nr:Hypothetical protein Ecym_2488 [Eremothecium cymbalariae DBVPG\
MKHRSPYGIYSIDSLLHLCVSVPTRIMKRTRTAGRTHSTVPPPGFENVKETLDDFDRQLKELQTDSAKASRLSARANEPAWQVFRITHERSRYIYNLFYRRKAISRQLYRWLLNNRYADRHLIAKWKKRGYEKLCCIPCIQQTETQYGSTCICRVPRATLEKNSVDGVTTFKNCSHCGCSGCASTD